MTAILRQIVEADDGAVAEKLAQVIVDRALAGDFRFCRENLNRIDGKVKDQVGNDGQVKVVIRHVDESN